MKRSSQHRTQGRRRQRGIALILCLFALLLLSSVALGLIYMADTETVINRNFRSSQQAYFAANAGLEEARSRLTPGLDSPPGIATPTALPGLGPGSLVYILNPKVVNGTLETVEPWNPALGNPYYDTELCHENYGSLGLPKPAFDAPCTPAAIPPVWLPPVESLSPGTKTTSALNFKWVRINLKQNASGAHGGTDLGKAGGLYVDGGDDSVKYNKQVCWDGSRELLKDDAYATCDLAGYKPVVILTALAQGSRRITQMEVAQNPPIITNAAVDSQDYVTLNGKLGIDGYDYCSCEAVKDGKGNVSYQSRPDKTCDASKWAIYSANKVETPGPSEFLVSGHTPPYAQNQEWPYDIAAYIDSYKSSPATVDVRNSPYKWTCSGTPPNCGTQTGASFGVPPAFPPTPPDKPDPPGTVQYTYVPGNLKITDSATGNGVLIVDGDLEINGGLQFYGLILVKGVVTFTGGGSQKTNIYGAVLAGQSSIDNTTLGGSANIVYDLCALQNGRAQQPPSVLSFRELNY